MRCRLICEYMWSVAGLHLFHSWCYHYLLDSATERLNKNVRQAVSNPLKTRIIRFIFIQVIFTKTFQSSFEDFTMQ